MTAIITHLTGESQRPSLTVLEVKTCDSKLLFPRRGNIPIP